MNEVIPDFSTDTCPFCGSEDWEDNGALRYLCHDCGSGAKTPEEGDRWLDVNPKV